MLYSSCIGLCGILATSSSTAIKPSSGGGSSATLPAVIQLNPWPIARDTFCFCAFVFVFVAISNSGVVTWLAARAFLFLNTLFVLSLLALFDCLCRWESLILLCCYIIYLIILFFNESISKFIGERIRELRIDHPTGSISMLCRWIIHLLVWDLFIYAVICLNIVGLFCPILHPPFFVVCFFALSLISSLFVFSCVPASFPSLLLSLICSCPVVRYFSQ